MAKVFYFVVTFLESGLAVFGIRSPFETTPYRVVSQLGDNIEIRAYGPRVVAETRADGDGDAFSRLFRYITGANRRDATIAMTTPVEMRGTMAGGAKTGGPDAAPADGDLMRFVLPKAIAADPPPPRDPKVHVVDLPARTSMVLRFSGLLDRASVARHEAVLQAALAKSHRKAEGPPYVMGYDPPFTIPFLRRNEVAIDVEP